LYEGLTRSWKVGTGAVLLAFVGAIFVQIFALTYKERSSTAFAQEDSIIRLEGKAVFGLFGPYVIVTNPYLGPATPEGQFGVVRSVIVKAEQATPNLEAYAILHISLPDENPSGCLQVFDQINTWLHFTLCDPSQWDAKAWFGWALLVLGSGVLGGIPTALAVISFTIGALVF